jgi:hypothetical protein
MGDVKSCQYERGSSPAHLEVCLAPLETRQKVFSESSSRYGGEHQRAERHVQKRGEEETDERIARNMSNK